jgi:hypothetical protein
MLSTMFSTIQVNLPTPAQASSAMDFLSAIELASDPKKAKAALASIKGAQDALSDQAQALEKAKAEIEAATKKLEAQENKSLSATLKNEESVAKSTKAIADVQEANDELEALRLEIGNKQGALDLRQQEFDAYVKRKEADFKREEKLTAAANVEVEKAAAKAAADAQAAADLRVIYESKLAQLQALAG